MRHTRQLPYQQLPELLLLRLPLLLPLLLINSYGQS
jgi:hypothetical protein